MLHFQSRSDKVYRCIVIAYYAQPSTKSKCDREFQMLAKSLQQRYPDDAIIAMGDFNDSRNEVKPLLNDNNLIPAPVQTNPV